MQAIFTFLGGGGRFSLLEHCPLAPGWLRARAAATSHQGHSVFHPSGVVNEYQLRLGRQREVWLIPLTDETQDVQVKL